MQAVWDRFDLYGTGFIELNQLPILLAITRHNIKFLCSSGKVTHCWLSLPRLILCTQVDQHDMVVYNDYTSFGEGSTPTDFYEVHTAFFSCKHDLLCAKTQRTSRTLYSDLLDTIARAERALEVPCTPWLLCLLWIG